MTAIADFTAATNLRSSLTSLRTETKNVPDGLAANDGFLSNVKKLIDKNTLGTEEKEHAMMMNF